MKFPFSPKCPPPALPRNMESRHPQENTVKMTGYRNKYEMMDGIAKEANQDRNEELARTRPEEYKMDTNGVLQKL